MGLAWAWPFRPSALRAQARTWPRPEEEAYQADAACAGSGYQGKKKRGGGGQRGRVWCGRMEGGWTTPNLRAAAKCKLSWAFSARLTRHWSFTKGRGKAVVVTPRNTTTGELTPTNTRSARHWGVWCCHCGCAASICWRVCRSGFRFWVGFAFSGSSTACRGLLDLTETPPRKNHHPPCPHGR